jgi:hypothetical protein
VSDISATDQETPSCEVKELYQVWIPKMDKGNTVEVPLIPEFSAQPEAIAFRDTLPDEIQARVKRVTYF